MNMIVNAIMIIIIINIVIILSSSRRSSSSSSGNISNKIKVYAEENSSVKKRIVLKFSIEFTRDGRTKFILIILLKFQDYSYLHIVMSCYTQQ